MLAAGPRAIARCVCPVPGPPTRTTLCASVKAVVASVPTSLRCTAVTSKSKPAMPRCTGNLAAFIWWLTERRERSVPSACSRHPISPREDLRPALPPCPSRSAHAPAMPCRRRALGSNSTSDSMAALKCMAAAGGTGAAFSRPGTLNECSTPTFPGGPLSSANPPPTPPPPAPHPARRRHDGPHLRHHAVARLPVGSSRLSSTDLLRGDRSSPGN